MLENYDNQKTCERCINFKTCAARKKMDEFVRYFEDEFDYVDFKFNRYILLANSCSEFKTLSKVLLKDIESFRSHEDLTEQEKHIEQLNKEGKYDEVLLHCDEALKDEPNNVVVLNRKAVALNELTRLDEAIPIYEKIFRLTKNLWSLIFAGKNYWELKKFKESIETLEKVVELSNNNQELREAYRYLAFSHAGLGEYDKAISYHNTLIEIDPKNHLNFYNKGIIYYNKGLATRNHDDFKLAVSCYDKCLELNPDYLDAIVNKADCLLQLNQKQIALELILKVLEKDEHYLPALEWLTEYWYFKDKNAGMWQRLGFYFSHEIQGHDVVFAWKNLGKTTLFTISCKTCKKGITTEYNSKNRFPNEPTLDTKNKPMEEP